MGKNKSKNEHAAKMEILKWLKAVVEREKLVGDKVVEKANASKAQQETSKAQPEAIPNEIEIRATENIKAGSG